MSINQIVSWTTSCVVALVLIISIVISGSPSEQRLIRLDERRVENLVRLSAAFDDYWEERDSLPEEINELLDGRRLSRMPTDPQTALAYEYERLDHDTYQLCATFDRPSPAQRGEDFWVHDAGEHCFSFVQAITEND